MGAGHLQIAVRKTGALEWHPSRARGGRPSATGVLAGVSPRTWPGARGHPLSSLKATNGF